MESERLSTAIIPVNELHFLALEEKLNLFKNPESLDLLPITRLVGSALKSDVPMETVETMPWEEAEGRKTEKIKYDYYFLNPEHNNFSLQFADKRYTDLEFRTCCITHLQLRIDIYPKENEIFELTFSNKLIPNKSDTRKQALALIERYCNNYGLYRPIKSGDEEQTRLWLGRLHCLELRTIRKTSKMAKNAHWKKASDVTNEYLIDCRKQGDFFPRLERKTGGIVFEAYKIFDSTRRGWILDGLVNPRRIT